MYINNVRYNGYGKVKCGNSDALKKWSIPVTDQLDQAVEKAVKPDAHVSKSDFIRDAVREKLRKMGFWRLAQLSKRKAKIKEDGTLASCIGQNRPIPPNLCKECSKHGDLTCADIKGSRKNGK